MILIFASVKVKFLLGVLICISLIMMGLKYFHLFGELLSYFFVKIVSSSIFQTIVSGGVPPTPQSLRVIAVLWLLVLSWYLL